MFLLLEIIRNTSLVHLDDVHPNIKCDESLLKKADIFYVIPLFENVSIADHSDWCNYILSFNKTLAMHGVQHTYQEFNIERNSEYIQDGAEVFKACFGYYPTRFKAPQVSLSYSNAMILEEEGYDIDTLFGDLLHKVYHCDDGGTFHNTLADLI